MNAPKPYLLCYSLIWAQIYGVFAEI